MSYKKRLEDLQKEFDQYKKESIKWSIEDFTSFEKSEDTLYPITEEDAQKLLEDMIKHHDASLGITWDTVESYLQNWEIENE